MVAENGNDVHRLRLQALHSGLSQASCRLWLSWHSGIQGIISHTSKYLQETPEQTDELLSQWQALITGCAEEWARLVKGPCLTTSEADQADENLEIDEGNVDQDVDGHNW